MRRDVHSARTAWLIAAGLVAFMLVLAGCGGGDDTGGGTTGGGEGSTSGELQKLGKGEGEVNLISWAGYVEEEWTKPFEAESGCKVNNKVAGTSDEMVQLMETGQYDGVSASGNASARLWAAGEVDPVNTALVPNYKTVFPDLKDQVYNTFEGVPYGIPHGRGANLLMWNSDKVKPGPKSWNVTLDPKVAAKFKGHISQYDDPMSIAEGAVYLKYHEPSLGIENPYELNEEQFDAAVELMKEQHSNVGEYWSDAAKQIQSFTSADSTSGTTWQYQVNQLQGAKDPVPVEATLPDEGSTGWSDTWMIASTSKHPNCMYLWMDYIISPAANAKATEYFGEAPVSAEACELTADKDHCTKFHAEDEDYFSKVYYWTTPVADCGDDRGDVCKDYSEWTTAWTEIRG